MRRSLTTTTRMTHREEAAVQPPIVHSANDSSSWHRRAAFTACAGSSTDTASVALHPPRRGSERRRPGRRYAGRCWPSGAGCRGVWQRTRGRRAGSQAHPRGGAHLDTATLNSSDAATQALTSKGLYLGAQRFSERAALARFRCVVFGLSDFPPPRRVSCPPVFTARRP